MAGSSKSRKHPAKPASPFGEVILAIAGIREIKIMFPNREAHWLVPLGRIAVFYVPADKLRDPRFGRDGATAAEVFDQFFLDNFGGFTHEESKIQGKWVPPDGRKVFTELHERYEVSFSGRKKGRQLLCFLSEMCGRLEEDSIYLTIGARSWLIKPRGRTER
jgi:hypothetical protein